MSCPDLLAIFPAVTISVSFDRAFENVTKVYHPKQQWQSMSAAVIHKSSHFFVVYQNLCLGKTIHHVLLKWSIGYSLVTEIIICQSTQLVCPQLKVNF